MKIVYLFVYHLKLCYMHNTNCPRRRVLEYYNIYVMYIFIYIDKQSYFKQ